MRRIWFGRGTEKPEEFLVVAEFTDFVWLTSLNESAQERSDGQRFTRREYVFETEFEAVSNQGKILQELKNEEWSALGRLHSLARKKPE